MASIGFLPSLSLSRHWFPFQNLSRQISNAYCLQAEGKLTVIWTLQTIAEKLKVTEATPLARESLKTLPYYIYRTASEQLPVYQITKRGNARGSTRIRKITGNVTQLKNDIQQSLRLKKTDVKVNSLTTHIIIKV